MGRGDCFKQKLKSRDKETDRLTLYSFSWWDCLKCYWVDSTIVFCCLVNTTDLSGVFLATNPPLVTQKKRFLEFSKTAKNNVSWVRLSQKHRINIFFGATNPALVSHFVTRAGLVARNTPDWRLQLLLKDGKGLVLFNDLMCTSGCASAFRKKYHTIEVIYFGFG